MEKKQFQTPCGAIVYWIQPGKPEDLTLVFLPGLTADHRLFDPQIEAFQGKYPLLVWDPPGHGESWPFQLNFTLMEKASWLEGILKQEGIRNPVIIGQSMGGYVGQAYAQQYPDRIRGFMAIDSAPLQRKFVTAGELWLLKRMEPVYRHYPWKWLLWSGTKGVSTTRQGRELMHRMMMRYDGQQRRYARLAGHGFRILAEAMEADLPYAIPCPAVLLCGEKDMAGSCKRYARSWHKATGIPLVWIKNAGHNSNTDRPELVNREIDRLLARIARKTGREGDTHVPEIPI